MNRLSYSSFSPFQSIFDNTNISNNNTNNTNTNNTNDINDITTTTTTTNNNTNNSIIDTKSNTEQSYVQLTNTNTNINSGNRCYVCGWTASSIFNDNNDDEHDDDTIRRLHDYHQLCQLKENLRDEYTNSNTNSNSNNSIRKDIIELQATIENLEKTIDSLTNNINDGNVLLTSHHFTKIRNENEYNNIYNNNINTNSIIEMKTLIIDEVI